jgi:hypothetical protein
MLSFEPSEHVRGLLVLAGLALAGAALSIGAYATFHGSPLFITYTTALTAWWGYLIAHKVATGVFIDNPFEATSEQSAIGRMNTLVGMVGVVVLVSGMVVGAIGIRNDLLGMSVVGGLLFVSGYATAHYWATGKIL